MQKHGHGQTDIHLHTQTDKQTLHTDRLTNRLIPSQLKRTNKNSVVGIDSLLAVVGF